MSFLALYNSDCASVRPDRNGGNEFEDQTVFLGKSGQISFFWTDPHSASRPAGMHAERDGRFWIIGRARLDDRESLCRKLLTAPTDSDILLCLRSYAKWGEQSPEHLQGDFCFVLWDEDRRHLFSVRDQLGVRPLFYAQTGATWLVSDSVDAICDNSQVCRDIDDHWIYEFLTEGRSLDFQKSIYREIRRLPPAHTLTLSSEKAALRRYWALHIQAPLFYDDEKTYIERFHELLGSAIRDRLPQGQLGIAMSGGLDSTTLAAKAVTLLGDASRVVADTCYFDRLIPDDEKRFSSLVTSRLGVRHTLRPLDDKYYDPIWHTRVIHTPEPTFQITRAVLGRQIDLEMAKEASVWFFGEGPDNALTFEWNAYIRWLWSNSEWRRACAAGIWCLFGRKSRAWHAIMLRGATMWRKADTEGPQPSDWLNVEFVKRMELAQTSEEPRGLGKSPHPWRPRALASFSDPIWPQFLEAFDETLTGAPIEYRHPFLDLRVLTFLLSVPPVPWARRKLLIREAMKDALPIEVLSRDKAPLIENPLMKLVQEHPLPVDPLCEEMKNYVDERKVPSRPSDASETEAVIRVRILDHWLKNRR